MLDTRKRYSTNPRLAHCLPLSPHNTHTHTHTHMHALSISLSPHTFHPFPLPTPLSIVCMSVQSQAMHRLATAHKAVLGTLQKHFSACASARCSRPLPAELALLVERLVLLGTQLHIDGDQGELLEDIKVHVRRPTTAVGRSELSQLCSGPREDRQ